jgi:drug/metabolite transporter (DMT)-like permease
MTAILPHVGAANVIDDMETAQQGVGESSLPSLITWPATDRSGKLHARTSSLPLDNQTAPTSSSISLLEVITDDESISSPPRIHSNGSMFSYSSGNGMDRTIESPTSPAHPYKADVETWSDKLVVALALMAWYVISILSIVTTKILLQNWNCPPIVLTVQQLVLGTILLRGVLIARDGMIQPWPWDSSPSSVVSSTTMTTTSTSTSMMIPKHHNNHEVTRTKSFESPRGTMKYELWTDRMKRQFPWLKHPNFIFSGVCNACDFLASNLAFSISSAHFVETIKASEPITTTAIALFWKVDRLSTLEASSLAVLICGALLSTWGNSTDENHPTVADEQKLVQSIQTASLAICANVFFGFRAIHQKKYRATTHATQQLDDVNFLCRMMQVGATCLLIPTVLLHFHMLGPAIIHAPSDVQLTYIGLAMMNAVSYVTYK